LRVFVEAKGQVCGGCGEEFGGPGGSVGGGFVVKGGEGGVEEVGGEVGAGVEAEDQEKGAGSQVVCWAGEEGAEGGLDRGEEVGATGGVFDYGARWRLFRVCEGISVGGLLYRSMAVMTGATHTPAVAAERRSPPSL